MDMNDTDISINGWHQYQLLTGEGTTNLYCRPLFEPIGSHHVPDREKGDPHGSGLMPPSHTCIIIFRNTHLSACNHFFYTFPCYIRNTEDLHSCHITAINILHNSHI